METTRYLNWSGPFLQICRTEQSRKRFPLLHTKVGPMIVGNVDMNQLCQAGTTHTSDTICVVTLSSGSEIKKNLNVSEFLFNDKEFFFNDNEQL